MRRNHCFDCASIQPKRTDEDFATVCEVSGEPTDPGADACADFTPEVKRTKRTPPAAVRRQGAKVGGENYTIQNKFARRVCRGLNWEFVPRNLKEEIAFAAMLDSVRKMIAKCARRVVRKAANSIKD